jgi:hypothetical protein
MGYLLIAHVVAKRFSTLRVWQDDVALMEFVHKHPPNEAMIVCPLYGRYGGCALVSPGLCGTIDLGRSHGAFKHCGDPITKEGTLMTANSAEGVRWNLDDLFAPHNDPRIDEILNETRWRAESLANRFRSVMAQSRGGLLAERL